MLVYRDSDRLEVLRLQLEITMARMYPSKKYFSFWNSSQIIDHVKVIVKFKPVWAEILLNVARLLIYRMKKTYINEIGRDFWSLVLKVYEKY